MDTDLSGLVDFFCRNYISLLSLPLLLSLSAFFSASEVAFFSLNTSSIAEKANSDKAFQNIQTVLATPKRFLATILIGNTLTNVMIAIIGISTTEQLILKYEWPRPLAIGVDLILISLFILIFGEIAPKTYAAKYAEGVARSLARFISVFQIVLYPFSEAAIQVSKLLETLVVQFKIKIRGQKAFSNEEIQVIAEIGIERANLEKTEKQLIDNVLDFREKPVRKVMTPRTDIEAIEVSTPIQGAIELVAHSKRSRLPLYENSLDNILGVVYAKDLVKFMNSRKKFDKEQWQKIARQPIFVPETQHLDDVLREFQKTRTHLAIVVDEYGGTAGIATLEDVIEEIVGELSPSQQTDEPLHKKLQDGTHWFNASIPLEEASELLGKPLGHFQKEEDDNFDTLGGFILHFTGEIPDEHQRVKYADLEFEIEKLEGNRILSVFVRHINQ